MSDNITFVTHLRYDHEDRIKNLQTIINYYSSNFPRSKFIFIEDDKEHNKNFDNIVWPKKRSTFFFIKNNSYYYRTRALNYGIKKANTPIVVSLDTDCIVPVNSINKCVHDLLNESTIAWPYNGYFIDTSARLHDAFKDSNYNYEELFNQLPDINNLNLGQVGQDFSVRCTNTVYKGLGGIVMFNRERFLEIGGYNEKFICWGAEDDELFCRCKILEHKLFRDEDINSICFHLAHRNATRHHHPHYESNFAEVKLVEGMGKDELQKYIKTWNQFIK